MKSPVMRGSPAALPRGRSASIVTSPRDRNRCPAFRSVIYMPTQFMTIVENVLRGSLMNADPISLFEVLDFRPHESSIYLGMDKMMLLSTSALTRLKRDLIDTAGVSGARKLLLRMAYVQGYQHGLFMTERYGMKRAVPLGPQFGKLEGFAAPTILARVFDPGNPSFHMESTCTNSVEAEEYSRAFGTSNFPVCWFITGFASGYHSAVCSKPIYFEEQMCKAQGHACCHILGNDAGSRDHSIAAEDFSDIRAEIDQRFRDSSMRRLRLNHTSQLPVVGLNLSGDGGEGCEVRNGTIICEGERFIIGYRLMAAAVREALQVAPLPTTVLICGESGTGKEFIAQLIHKNSGRANSPFVSLNCAAVTESLLESELFGHVRGSFTGAIRDKVGLLELAKDGTLFLDEVGDMPISTQAKLLRALELRQIRKVGGESDIKIRARIVAATNVNLPLAIEAGRFRRDLYFRLAGFVIQLAPLRERCEDIPTLAYEFLKRATATCGKPIASISPEAMGRLLHYSWPGNVRELKHAIERAVIVSGGGELQADDLPLDMAARHSDHIPDSLLGFDLKQHERHLILQSLVEARGNRSVAARALNIDPATLWRKIRQYKIDIPKRSKSGSMCHPSQDIRATKGLPVP